MRADSYDANITIRMPRRAPGASPEDREDMKIGRTPMGIAGNRRIANADCARRPAAAREESTRSTCAEEGTGKDEPTPGGGIDWDTLPASITAWVRVLDTTVDYTGGRRCQLLSHALHRRRALCMVLSLHRPGLRAGRRDPAVIVYGHHMSDDTIFAPLAQYSTRPFAEGHCTIWVFTRKEAIELEVFATDVTDADSESSEGKQANF